MTARRFWRNLDYLLIAVTLALMATSAVVVYSASHMAPVNGDPAYYLKRQLLWIGLGLAVMIAVALIHYEELARLATVLYVANLGLLVAVLLVGQQTKGAERWLTLGPVPVQPSELAKLVIILTLASQLARREEPIRRLYEFIPPFVHVALPMALILLQPDLGTAMVFVGIVFGVLFLSGAAWKPLAALAGAALGGAAGLTLLYLRYGVAVAGRAFLDLPRLGLVPLPLREYQVNRLIVFADPSFDLQGAGYHLAQSKIAIGSGGLWGRGLFQGTQTQLNFLPEQHTDFIFSVIGEELGFAGAALLLLLYFVFMWRGLWIAARARDRLGTLLAGGIVSMLAFQVMVNVGMTLGIMPITGIPLPFMSYGGSSMVTKAAAVGLLLGIHRRRHRIQF